MGIARSFCRRDAQQRRRLHAALGFKVEGVDESHSRLDPAYCARSMLAVMMLAATMGSTIRLETNGPDESAAMSAMVQLIVDRFGEAI